MFYSYFPQHVLSFLSQGDVKDITPGGDEVLSRDVHYFFEYDKMTLIPDFVHLESEKQCNFNRFRLNFSIDKTVYKWLYLLDTTKCIYGSVLQSTQLSSCIHRLSSRNFRKSLRRGLANIDEKLDVLDNHVRILYVEQDYNVNFFIYTYNEKFLMAAYTLLEPKEFFNVYGKSRKGHDFIIPQATVESNRASDKCYFSHLLQGVESTRKVPPSSSLDYRSDPIQNPTEDSSYHSQKTLDEVMNKFLSDPSFYGEEAEDILLVPSVCRFKAFMSAVRKMFPATSIAYLGHNVVYIHADPSSCKRMHDLRNLLRMSNGSEYVVNIVEDSLIEYYQVPYKTTFLTKTANLICNIPLKMVFCF